MLRKVILMYILNTQISDLVAFCRIVYEEIAPSLDNPLVLFAKAKYIHYVMIPEAILLAIQILRGCGVQEAETYFSDTSISSAQQELEELSMAKGKLNKQERRAVNRRTLRVAEKSGINVHFSRDELYDSSDEY